MSLCASALSAQKATQANETSDTPHCVMMADFFSSLMGTLNLDRVNSDEEDARENVNYLDHRFEDDDVGHSQQVFLYNGREYGTTRWPCNGQTRWIKGGRVTAWQRERVIVSAGVRKPINSRCHYTATAECSLYIIDQRWLDNTIILDRDLKSDNNVLLDVCR